jgi:hypothetical protein
MEMKAKRMTLPVRFKLMRVLTICVLTKIYVGGCSRVLFLLLLCCVMIIHLPGRTYTQSFFDLWGMEKNCDKLYINWSSLDDLDMSKISDLSMLTELRSIRARVLLLIPLRRARMCLMIVHHDKLNLRSLITLTRYLPKERLLLLKLSSKNGESCSKKVLI